MKAKLTKVTQVTQVTQDMEALQNKKRSYLEWIEFTTTVNYMFRIESFWYFMMFSVLLMLSKGFRLIKGYVVFLRRKTQKRKG